MAKTYTALVLQGGGGLGAFEYGVLKALYEEPDFRPDILVGVSIGAVAAAVVVGAKAGPMLGLEQLWRHLSTPTWPILGKQWQWLSAWPHNSGLYQPSMQWLLSPWSATGLYDLLPLRKTLERLIDLDRLNAADAPQLVMTATNVATGTIEEFDNRNHVLTLAHILASGSLPPFFPMTEIEGQHYWDGGMFSNTPLRPAVNRLEQLGTAHDRREIILVELFPQAAPVPDNLLAVYDRMSQMFFSSKLQFDAAQFQRYNQLIDLFQHLDQCLPAEDPVRQLPGFQDLQKHRRIHSLQVIRNIDPAGFTAGVDFSRETIECRIQQGYESAKKQRQIINSASLG